VEFERFADDAVVHCATERQARQVRAALSDLRVPKTCATWAKALQGAVERPACAGPVLARPEVG
jgi:hypothetical protein